MGLAEIVWSINSKKPDPKTGYCFSLFAAQTAQRRWYPSVPGIGFAE
jgi:hypothetical protein